MSEENYSAPSVEMPYQGVAIRFVALLIDAIILGIVSYILIFLFAASAITVDTSTGASFVWAGVLRSSRFGHRDRTALLHASLRALWAIGRYDGSQDKSGQRGRQRTDHLRSGVCTYDSAVY